MKSEVFKILKEVKETNNKIKILKRKNKALDKIIKLCKENNLELTKGKNKELIIKGILY